MVSVDAREANRRKPFDRAADSRLSGGGRIFKDLNVVAVYPIGSDVVVWGGRNGREWAAGVEVKL